MLQVCPLISKQWQKLDSSASWSENLRQDNDGLGVPDIRRQEVDWDATRQRDRCRHLGTKQKDLWGDLPTILLLNVRDR